MQYNNDNSNNSNNRQYVIILIIITTITRITIIITFLVVAVTLVVSWATSSHPKSRRCPRPCHPKPWQVCVRPSCQRRQPAGSGAFNRRLRHDQKWSTLVVTLRRWGWKVYFFRKHLQRCQWIYCRCPPFQEFSRPKYSFRKHSCCIWFIFHKVLDLNKTVSRGSLLTGSFGGHPRPAGTAQEQLGLTRVWTNLVYSHLQTWGFHNNGPLTLRASAMKINK